MQQTRVQGSQTRELRASLYPWKVASSGDSSESDVKATRALKLRTNVHVLSTSRHREGSSDFAGKPKLERKKLVHLPRESVTQLALRKLKRARMRAG